MPLPKPSKNEKQDDYISRCVSFVKNEDPNIDDAKATAMCIQQWDTSKGENMSDKKFDEEGREIIAENVPIIIEAYIEEDD